MAADDTLPIRSDPLDELRQYLLEASPALQAEAQALTKLLRDSVELDRLKFTRSGAHPTQAELDAWAHSSAHLYNDPPFEKWLEAYRASRPNYGVAYLYKTRHSSAGQPQYTGKAFLADGVSCKAAAWLSDDGKLRIVLVRETAA